MGKKLTIEYVRDEFFKEWYILLTKIYINAFQKLEYICPNGHRHSICWNNWQQGKRCPICSKKIKLTIELIREFFENDNHTLLTTEYINNSQKLDYICPNGHRHSMSWNNWKQGARCPYCYGNAKLTIEFINEFFEEEDYNLLTKVYINSYQKLDYICPEGHKHSITWDSWKQGHRCPSCAKNIKLTIEFIIESFKKEGYIILTKEYINNKQKLEYICPLGHKHFIDWHHWQRGHRCPTCAIINNQGCSHYNWKGGISKEPYCQDWGKDLKEFVKERDGYKCMNPDCWGKDKTLSVHHINYNKKSCGPENLITVCRSCNTRANTDREWHESWYKAILNKRYNYIY